ncbi:MAG: DUF3800 domain-containing protein [Burkholderiales bacterium]|jgi:hypothetical protein
MSRELILYCDESDISGRHFGNFYGGALVESVHQQEVIARLQAKKTELNLLGEVKWQKITEAYAQKYMDLTSEVFALVGEGKLKLRIMFTQNYFSAHRLTESQRENGFFLLYYQFIKHTFGLRFAGKPDAPAPSVRIYFDKLPDTDEKCAAFKGYVTGLNHSAELRRAGVQLRADQLAEIDSKEHVILQALDIVLGAMQFRLNDKHKEIPAGATRRGKRTVAKERVYKHILAQICALYDGKRFNIGISTGRPNGMQDLWAQPYRHWLFKPADGAIRPEFAKRNKSAGTKK